MEAVNALNIAIFVSCRFSFVGKVPLAPSPVKILIRSGSARRSIPGVFECDVTDNCDWESPLNNEVLRQEQLEVLSQLARCRYTKTARMVHELFEETKAKAQSGQMNRKVFEEKITWLVYLIGALVGSNWTGRLPDVHVEGEASFIAPFRE